MNKNKPYIFIAPIFNVLSSCTIFRNNEIEKLYFDEYDFKYAKDKLLQSSLFS